MTEPVIAPYGAWSSPIRIDDVVGDVVVLAEPWVDGDDVFWIEGRPTEGLDWQRALDSGMLELVREGRLAEAKELLQACLSSSSG